MKFFEILQISKMAAIDYIFQNSEETSSVCNLPLVIPNFRPFRSISNGFRDSKMKFFEILRISKMAANVYIFENLEEILSMCNLPWVTQPHQTDPKFSSVSLYL